MVDIDTTLGIGSGSDSSETPAPWIHYRTNACNLLRTVGGGNRHRFARLECHRPGWRRAPVSTSKRFFISCMFRADTYCTARIKRSSQRFTPVWPCICSIEVSLASVRRTSCCRLLLPSLLCSTEVSTSSSWHTTSVCVTRCVVSHVVRIFLDRWNPDSTTATVSLTQV